MITKLLFLFSFVTPILTQHVNANIYDNPSRDLLNKYYSNMNKCCNICYNDTEKYYSIPNSAEDTCGESCIKPENYNKMKIFEPKLTKAETKYPCLEKGFSYLNTEVHGFGPIKVKVDMYTKSDIQSKSCGTCGVGYQSCCIGFAIDGYPCDCHLEENGSGKAGSNCGDCGTAFSACCIGYAADGYPCECDVM